MGPTVGQKDVLGFSPVIEELEVDLMITATIPQSRVERLNGKILRELQLTTHVGTPISFHNCGNTVLSFMPGPIDSRHCDYGTFGRFRNAVKLPFLCSQICRELSSSLEWFRGRGYAVRVISGQTNELLYAEVRRLSLSLLMASDPRGRMLDQLQIASEKFEINRRVFLPRFSIVVTSGYISAAVGSVFHAGEHVQQIKTKLSTL